MTVLGESALIRYLDPPSIIVFNGITNTVLNLEKNYINSIKESVWEDL